MQKAPQEKKRDKQKSRPFRQRLSVEVLLPAFVQHHTEQCGEHDRKADAEQDQIAAQGFVRRLIRHTGERGTRRVAFLCRVIRRRFACLRRFCRGLGRLFGHRFGCGRLGRCLRVCARRRHAAHVGHVAGVKITHIRHIARVEAETAGRGRLAGRRFGRLAFSGAAAPARTGTARIGRRGLPPTEAGGEKQEEIEMRNDRVRRGCGRSSESGQRSRGWF